MDYATAMNTFDSGKAAVAFNGSWEAGRILTGDSGIIPFPAPTAEQASLRGFLDVILGIPTKSEHQDVAAKFVQYMAAGEGVDGWATQLKGVPALAGYTLPEGTLKTELQKTSYASMVELINQPHSDRNNMGAFSDSVGENVLEVLTGNLSAEKAAQKRPGRTGKGQLLSPTGVRCACPGAVAPPPSTSKDVKPCLNRLPGAHVATGVTHGRQCSSCRRSWSSTRSTTPTASSFSPRPAPSGSASRSFGRSRLGCGTSSCSSRTTSSCARS